MGRPPGPSEPPEYEPLPDPIVPYEDDHGYAAKAKNENPWWNDGDKVAGLIATMIFVGGVGLGLLILFTLTIRWLF